MKKNNEYFIKTTILILFFSLSFKNITAQNSSFNENVRFGGGIGLGFSNNFFSATLEPSALYQFNSQWALGVGLNFTYNSQKDFYKSTIIGGTLTGLYTPIPNIQLSGEFQQLHVNRKYDNAAVFYRDEKYWFPALLLGVGYQTNNVTVGVRYDVLYDDDKSIYGSPWSPFLRVYF
ncbi:alpha-ketoglutarate decarboxylase [Formosa sediminum]|uniref:Alpha-ketoglutarate decarboxylase n=1 Tax=Formosa sediminum TaxID=2594004 RepID=A0A516GNB9_9FLAO|nr:alpha-ketoglutarate decarboxylase [Formosa sediminum]QDO92999.1 alpha-ketoglutarate decarboxylase [Formosa sediminum]